ncbi:DUF4407 domain-containing protein [Microbacterium sp.]|uniref:DUF4407 domain-containing protein n=1 Tax=Microbacterium sp. TaxID=51671 RepID=UPI001ACF3541|nr:DUF4407 domain-containing protein [Microbacterium sp.]MBN9157139.1 DUF4407 domain-containing protein [Microbacterium sp.]
MSYSAHRPGRMDSQGRIAFDVDGQPDPANPADPTAEDPFIFVRDYTPTGSDPAEAPADDEAVTTPIEPVVPPRPPVPEPAPASEGEPDRIEELFSTAEPAAPEPVVPEPTPAPAVAAPAPAPTKPPKAPKPPREPRPQGWFWRRLAILGGADGAILDRVPSEQPRFVQMFFVLAGTALVSALSMLFALTTGVQVLVWLAVPLAVVWALLIFNLDRFLTSTMRSTRNFWRLLGLAIPRVLMAAIIGFVVAEPIVLQAFHNDIAREVTATNLVQAQSDQKAVATGPEKKALDAASTRLADLQNQASTGIVKGTSSDSASQKAAQDTVTKITAQMTDQQKVIDQARALYQCELTGQGAGTVPGCTGVQGDGASSTAAKSQLDQAQQTYDALAAQLRQANTDLESADASSKTATSATETQNRQQAKDQIPAAEQAYKAALDAYNARAADVAGTNAGAVGLLSQISALDRLSAKEPVLGFAHWLIAALFFMIELLPVIVKVLTSWGDPSLYEKAEAIAKQVELDRVTSKGYRDRAAIIAEEAKHRAFADAHEAEVAAASAEPATPVEAAPAAPLEAEPAPAAAAGAADHAPDAPTTALPVTPPAAAPAHRAEPPHVASAPPAVAGAPSWPVPAHPGVASAHPAPSSAHPTAPAGQPESARV